MDLRILSDEELLALAREINLELLRRVPASAPDASKTPDTPAPFAGRCPYCNGIGRKVDGEYCSCALGRDLLRVERRGLSRFSSADEKYLGPEPEYANEDDPEEES